MIERSRRKENVTVIKRRSLEDRDGEIGVSGRILARLINEKTGMIQEIEGTNLITSDGDAHYAQRATTQTPALVFQTLILSTSVTAPAKDFVYGDVAYIAGSTSVVSVGYPAANDTDGDNSGSGTSVITWRFAYTKAAFNSGVAAGVITTTGVQTSDSLALTHFVFASTFVKTSDDTLVVFVNHTVLGTS